MYLFIIYSMAVLLGLATSALAPAAPERSLEKRIKSAAKYALYFVFFASIAFAVVTRTPIAIGFGFAVLSAVWAAGFGALGGLIGSGFRTLYDRRRARVLGD